MAKVGDGTIATVDAIGQLLQMDFVAGLEAPKGTGIGGGMLDVADIDLLAAIDLASGAVTATNGGEGIVFLNGVTVGSDGTVYVSDTFGNAVYKIKDDGLALVAQGPGLSGANGQMPRVRTSCWSPIWTVSARVREHRARLGGGSRSVQRRHRTLRRDRASRHTRQLAADGDDGVQVSDNAAGTILRQMPCEVPTLITTLASGAADLDYNVDSGLIVVPITTKGRLVAGAWAP